MSRKVNIPDTDLYINVDEDSDTNYFDKEGIEHKSFWNEFSSGSWEYPSINLVSKCDMNGLLFIDLGAWIGPYSLLAATKGAQVLAFEPDPVAYDLLKKSIALNSFGDKITAQRSAASTSNQGVALFYDKLGNSETSTISGRKRADRNFDIANTIITPSFDFWKFLDTLDHDRVFVKCDIEGGEYDLIPYVADKLRDLNANLLLSTHPENISPSQNNNNFIRFREVRLFQSLMFYCFCWTIEDGTFIRRKVTDVIEQLRDGVLVEGQVFFEK